MTNRLAAASSPYLLQHADNPVDWHLWGDDAFAEARRRNVPIFLSVGYSSCHWCHVMAHESFEDADTAAALNDAFVNVKVDREERPDVDAVYMQALQAMSGHGGWPMSVFLTPDGEPFFAGTYWPKDDGRGMPSFGQVIDAVADAWQHRRDEVAESATRIADALAEHQAQTAPASAVDTATADAAAELTITQAWDQNLGGFGPAPKFPQAMTIEWLLARHARTGDDGALAAAVQSLDAMARGGIHDQLGGGFARYSTDAQWLVPHFEKMLYDNALLLSAYAEGAATLAASAARAVGDVEPDDLARVARATAGYLLGELRTGEGMFVSATDADSEGVEGRFFVWDYDELVDTLTDAGVDAQRWATFFGATKDGNFEGANVLHEPVPRRRFAQEREISPEQFDTELEQVRAALLAQRAQRIAPDVDDKVLTDWNALAVRALARAGVALDEPGWIMGAATAAEALHNTHVLDGRLHHSSRHGQLGPAGFFEDHALLALADLELLQATGDTNWFTRALALATDAHERFYDADAGGWFQTASDAQALYTRPKDTWDNAVPAGTSVMIEVCLKLAGLTGDLVWQDRAEEGIRLLQPQARRMPTGYGWLLRQIEAVAAGPREVVIVGSDGPARAALANVAHRSRRPGMTVLVVDEDRATNGQVPVLAGRSKLYGQAAAYVCTQMTCELPVTEPAELSSQLDRI